jgi:hypothetical protein
MGFGGNYQLPRKFVGISRVPGPAFVPIFGLGIVTYLIPVLQDNLSAWVGVGIAGAVAMGATYVVHLRHVNVARRQPALAA